MSGLFKRKTEKRKSKLVLYKDGSYLFNCDECNVASTGYFCEHFPKMTDIKDRRSFLKRREKK
jgi:hypothetical protein